MIPISAQSVAALRGVRFTQSAYAEMWQNGGKVATFELISGNLATDRSASARRSCTLTGIGFKSLTPVAAIGGQSAQTIGQPGGTIGQKGQTIGGYPTDGLKGLIALGTEVRVFYVITDFRGRAETVNVGRYRVSRVQFIDASDTEGITVQVEGYDLSRNLSQTQWSSPLSFKAGTNYADLMRTIVQAKAPGLTFNVTPTNHKTPGPVTFGAHKAYSTPWEDLLNICHSIGYELRVDYLGVLRAIPIPDPAKLPAVYTFADGDASPEPNVIKVEQTQDDSLLVNGVEVRAENVSLKDVPYSVIWDDDPASPYNRATVGEHLHRETSALVSTPEQATDMANGLYRTLRGLHEELTLTCIPTPHLEEGDIVQVKCSGININSRYIVERIDLPVDFSGPTTIVVSRRLD